MSDLQISLLALGAIVVAGVYLFNWLQERRLRRRLGAAFEHEHKDVLLEGGGREERGAGRIEPQLPPAGASREESAPQRAPGPAGEGGVRVAEGTAVAGLDAAIDYIAEIDSDTPISDSVLGELLGKLAAMGKPTRGAGYNSETGEWEDLVRTAGSRHTSLRLALQLVNRAGPANQVQLSAFCDAVRSCADKVPAVANCPDIHAALAAAKLLERFCAEVDVAIGVNIVARGGPFSGTKIRALAEAAGFKLEPDGVFHYRSEAKQTLFTLDNHEPAPFIPEQIKSLSTTGITLLMDVPRVADGLRVLDRMLEVGRNFAGALDGILVDDNRVALNEAGIGKIKQQLREIHAAMDERQVGAGSERALRLFS